MTANPVGTEQSEQPDEQMSDAALAKVWDDAVRATMKRSQITGHTLLSYHFGHRAIANHVAAHTRRTVLEEARRECEELSRLPNHPHWRAGCAECAAAIRQLASKQP